MDLSGTLETGVYSALILDLKMAQYGPVQGTTVK